MPCSDTKLIESVAATCAANAAETDRGVFFPEEPRGARVVRAARPGELAQVGGKGLGLPAAACVIERIARDAGSTAMIACMHYCATMVIEQHSRFRNPQRRSRAASTSAFRVLRADRGVSSGRRSARSDRRQGRAAHRHEDVRDVGASRRQLRVVEQAGGGIRADDAVARAAADRRAADRRQLRRSRLARQRLGAGHGGGRAAPDQRAPRRRRRRFRHHDGDGAAVVQRAVGGGVGGLDGDRGRAHGEARRCDDVRARRARRSRSCRRSARSWRAVVKTDQTKALNGETLAAIAGARADATLRVLECKAAAGEAAAEVTDLAMRVCGGAAFRKEVGIERVFRDARAALVMAPTTDVLYDFIGKAVCGLPLF